MKHNPVGIGGNIIQENKWLAEYTAQCYKIILR